MAMQERPESRRMARQIKTDFASTPLMGDESTMTQERMVSFLGKLDPAMPEVSITKLFQGVDKNGTGVIQFQEFVDYVCGVPDDSSKEASQPPKSTENQPPAPPALKKGDVVRVVNVLEYEGRLATVLDPSWNTVLQLVKVQFRGEVADDEDGDQPIVSLKPEDVVLEKLLEVDLQEQLDNLKRVAYSKLDAATAELESDRKKGQEAEERAKLAEERAKLAEERVERAEQAVEDQKKLASLDHEERLKAEEELRKKREEEEAERVRLVEQEEAKRKAEEDARLKAEEEATKKAKEEADEAARLRAEAAENEVKAKGANWTRLKVTVVRAEGLRAADRGGTSDPYCTIHVIGQKGDGTHPPFSTDIEDKTLSPEWNQTHIFDACTLSSELLFEVFDHDKWSKKLDHNLGSAILSPVDFRPDGFDDVLVLGEKKRWLHKSKGGADGPKLYVKVEVLPMIKVAGVPRCFVTFLAASNLRAADKNGKSDPYCIAEVPGKPMSRFKTAVKKKTLDPMWAEEAEINEYAKGDDIKLQVFDHDKGSALGDPLGSYLLKASKIEPNGFNGELLLEGKGALKDSMLGVIVDIF